MQLALGSQTFLEHGLIAWKKKKSKGIIVHHPKTEDKDLLKHLYVKQSLGRLNFS